MENKYKVRIMRSEIRNIKNVAYGDVMYMNYGSINKKAMCVNRYCRHLWAEWFRENSISRITRYVKTDTYRKSYKLRDV